MSYYWVVKGDSLIRPEGVCVFWLLIEEYEEW